ncbi:MAG: tetratricopeptide repeat protein [Anaerolineae bacterium]|nr:tetratricopeptide repeat protein [Anaerolineae bacterium]
MPKGALEQDIGIETALTKLRDMIRDLELQAYRLGGRGESAIETLRLRDRVERELESRRAAGMDVRAEQTRVETVDNMLRRQASILMGELRGMGGLEAARQEENPPEEYWWWYLDYEVSDRRRRLAVRSTIIIVAVLAVLLVGNYIMNRFFGMDPTEKAARNYSSQAEQILYEGGDRQEAIALYEQAIATYPEIPEAHATLAVLYEANGQEDEAAREFQIAREQLGDPVGLEITVARAYETVGNLDAALERVEAALALDPESPQAYFVRGSIYEAQQDTSQAIADFERASDLARERGEDALYVLARTRMAMLMQRAPSSGLGGF